MSPAKLALGFAPVVLYSVVVRWAGQGSVPVAALIACAVAVGLLVRGRLRSESPKLLVVASAVVFAGFAVIGLAAADSRHFLAGYGRALAPLVFGAVIFLALPVLPFTEQFTREVVPAQVAASPGFRALNRRLSAVWGAVVLGLAAGHALATALADQLSRAGELLLAWGIPVALLLAAVKYTGRLTADVRAQASSPPGRRPAGADGPAD